MNILVINGPNLNMLGQRNPEIYGELSYKNLIKKLKIYGRKNKIKLKFYQSNHEGKIIDYIQKNYHKFAGLIINPGGLTHYSYVLRDCLEIIEIPIIEVHLSNIYEREAFRKKSVIEDIVDKSIVGKHIQGYIEAIDHLMKGVKL